MCMCKDKRTKRQNQKEILTSCGKQELTRTFDLWEHTRKSHKTAYIFEIYFVWSSVHAACIASTNY